LLFLKPFLLQYLRLDQEEIYVLFAWILLYATEKLEIAGDLVFYVNRKEGWYDFFDPARSLHRGGTTVNQGPSFYLNCLVDLSEALENSNEQDFATKIAESYMRTYLKETLQYFSAWLYLVKYVYENTTDKDQFFQDNRPTVNQIDPVLTCEYKLRAGVLASRLGEDEEASALLGFVLGQEWPEINTQLVAHIKKTAFFYLAQTSYNLQNYQECSTCLAKINDDTAKNLIPLAEKRCVTDWFLRIERFVEYRTVIDDPLLNSLLEEGQFWDRNAPSDLTKIGLGLFYFSQGCHGTDQRARKLGLNLSKQYLWPYIRDNQTACTFYIRCLNILREPYKEFTNTLHPQHFQKLKEILNGQVLYLNDRPIFTQGENLLAKTFLEEGLPTASVSLDVPPSVVEALKDQIKPCDKPYFAAEQAFNQGNFALALTQFINAKDQGSSLGSSTDIMLCLLALGDENAFMEHIYCNGVNADLWSNVLKSAEEYAASEEAISTISETDHIGTFSEKETPAVRKMPEPASPDTSPPFSQGRPVEDLLRHVFRHKDCYTSSLQELIAKSKQCKDKATEQKGCMPVKQELPDISGLSIGLKWKKFNQEIIKIGWKCYRTTGTKHQYVYEIVDRNGQIRSIKIDAPHPGELDSQRISAQGYILQEIKKHLGYR
jgi:hypothetical protein